MEFFTFDCLTSVIQMKDPTFSVRWLGVLVLRRATVSLVIDDKFQHSFQSHPQQITPGYTVKRHSNFYTFAYLDPAPEPFFARSFGCGYFSCHMSEIFLDLGGNSRCDVVVSDLLLLGDPGGMLFTQLRVWKSHPVRENCYSVDTKREDERDHCHRPPSTLCHRDRQGGGGGG